MIIKHNLTYLVIEMNSNQWKQAPAPIETGSASSSSVPGPSPLAAAGGNATTTLVDAASASGGSAEGGVKRLSGTAGRSESSEQEIVLQTIKDYGGKMNVGA